MFEAENNYYELNKDKLQHDYLNKFVVIAGDSLFGVYDDVGVASLEAMKKFKPGAFMVKQVSNMPDDTQRFMSRVYV
ncbi:hypothetical protein FACS1894102_2240 [Spirochaetia bacterium]|nr:hypothetical protein FACS1894102_2240 [Spirochaetia bacterium]